jgi:molybdate transport system substrate-binding protein
MNCRANQTLKGKFRSPFSLGKLIQALTLALALLSTPLTAHATEPPKPHTLTVFAAASLTESFNAIGTAFHKEHPEITVQFNFAASSTLVQQIKEGAPVDVFASADEANMQKLVDAGQVAGVASIFASNRLIIVTPKGNPKKIASLADLTKGQLTLALGAPQVPVGKYAAEAFAKAGLTVPAASQEPDVKAVLNKVALGEADAGIVYVTDARAAGDRVDAIEIPDNYNVVAHYPIGVVTGATGDSNATAFVAFVRSGQARQILASFGFLPP